ncbi:membrane protein [Cohnella kolymensis]|uniref:Membrane protein n=1 Tax=Cohnella kolymensis TaxID=1590652 RepID=A0ABR5A4E3_9BACL|nr:DUF3817 domain-containing protein [Cohnella kolymensis]KIL35899.1 membrane protein [Cohnella kolymensis]
MLNTPIGRLRAVGFLEAVSFLVLLAIAMPLKYAAGMPSAVTVFGMLHGVLFILYLAAIVNAFFVRDVSFKQSLLVVAAAFVPFGPFLVDRKIR